MSPAFWVAQTGMWRTTSARLVRCVMSLSIGTFPALLATMGDELDDAFHGILVPRRIEDNIEPITGVIAEKRQHFVRTGIKENIREFLNQFQHFGLIEKRPNGGWLFQGFTTSFALELFEIREMFELCSVKAFATLPATSPPWRQVEAMRDGGVSKICCQSHFRLQRLKRLQVVVLGPQTDDAISQNP